MIDQTFVRRLEDEGTKRARHALLAPREGDKAFEYGYAAGFLQGLEHAKAMYLNHQAEKDAATQDL